MLNNSHKDLSVEDFEGKKVPCIGFEGRKFDDMLNKIAGKPFTSTEISVSLVFLLIFDFLIFF